MRAAAFFVGVVLCLPLLVQAQAAPSSPAVDADAALYSLLGRPEPPDPRSADPTRRLVQALAVEPAADALGPLQSAPLQLAFGELPLPFAYRVAARRRSLDLDQDGSAFSENVVIVAEDGPWAGRRLGFAAQLLGLQQAAGNAAGHAASQMAYRLSGRADATEPVDVAFADLGFVKMEHRTVAGDGREAVLAGDVLGQFALVAAVVPDVAGAPTPGELLTALRPDVDAILKLPSLLFDESARAVHGRDLRTALGPVRVPVRAPVRLIGIAHDVDGNGRTLAAAQMFELEREHLWWEKVQLRAACAAHAGGTPDVDRLEAVLRAGGDEPATRSAGRIGGLDAVRVDGRTAPGRNGYLDLGQWLAGDGRFAYSVRFTRALGKGIQGDFEKGMAETPFACDGGAMFAGLPGVG